MYLRNDLADMPSDIYCRFPRSNASRGIASLSNSLRRRPPLGQRLCLFQHRLRRPVLLVRRVAVRAKDPLEDHLEAGTYVLSDRPVDPYVVLHHSNPRAQQAIYSLSNP